MLHKYQGNVYRRCRRVGFFLSSLGDLARRLVFPFLAREKRWIAAVFDFFAHRFVAYHCTSRGVALVFLFS